MSVHQTTDGRWFAAYRQKGDREVRRKYFGCGAEGKIAAKKWEAQYLAEAVRPGQNAPARPALTFAVLAQKYLNARPLTPRTRENVVGNLNTHVLPVFGRRHVASLTMADLATVDEALAQKGRAQATRNRVRSYCKTICQWGFINDLTEANPFARYRPDLKKEGRAPDLVTEEEIQSIYQAAAPHLKWAMEVMLNTGVRPGASELFSLMMSDVDFEAGGVWVTRRKTNSPRTLLPLRPEFLARLRALVEHEPNRKYVIEYKGGPVRKLQTAWEAALRRAGISRRLRLYDLRHWYASTLLRGGADLKAASEMMGHSSPNLTLRTYYHLVEGQKREALAGLKIPELSPDRVK
jgi:integrase